MPDLNKCLLIDGKYYCWDSAKQQFFEVDARFKQLTSIPDKVLKVFIDKGILKVLKETSNA